MMRKIKPENNMNTIVEQIRYLRRNSNQRYAKVEVLLDSIIIEEENNITVYPSKCPGQGRETDVLFDDVGEAACMYKGKRCPYFISSIFRLIDYTKAINCKVM